MLWNGAHSVGLTGVNVFGAWANFILVSQEAEWVELRGGLGPGARLFWLLRLSRLLWSHCTATLLFEEVRVVIIVCHNRDEVLDGQLYLYAFPVRKVQRGMYANLDELVGCDVINRERIEDYAVGE
jgi:hypothetical protein